MPERFSVVVIHSVSLTASARRPQSLALCEEELYAKEPCVEESCDADNGDGPSTVKTGQGLACFKGPLDDDRW